MFGEWLQSSRNRELLSTASLLLAGVLFLAWRSSISRGYLALTMAAVAFTVGLVYWIKQDNVSQPKKEPTEYEQSIYKRPSEQRRTERDYERFLKSRKDISTAKTEAWDSSSFFNIDNRNSISLFREINEYSAQAKHVDEPSESALTMNKKVSFEEDRTPTFNVSKKPNAYWLSDQQKSTEAAEEIIESVLTGLSTLDELSKYYRMEPAEPKRLIPVDKPSPKAQNIPEPQIPDAESQRKRSLAQEKADRIESATNIVNKKSGSAAGSPIQPARLAPILESRNEYTEDPSSRFIKQSENSGQERISAFANADPSRSFLPPSFIQPDPLSGFQTSSHVHQAPQSVPVHSSLFGTSAAPILQLKAQPEPSQQAFTSSFTWSNQAQPQAPPTITKSSNQTLPGDADGIKALSQNKLLFEKLRVKSKEAENRVSEYRKEEIKDTINTFASQICSMIDQDFLGQCQKIIEGLDRCMSNKDEYVYFIERFVMKLFTQSLNSYNADKVKTVYAAVYVKIIAIYHPFLLEVLFAVVCRKFPWLAGEKIPVTEDREAYLKAIGFDNFTSDIDRSKLSKAEYIKKMATKITSKPKDKDESLFASFYQKLEVYSVIYFSILSCDLECQLKDVANAEFRQGTAGLATRYLQDWKNDTEQLYFKILSKILEAAPIFFQPLLIRCWLNVSSDVWQNVEERMRQIVMILVSKKLPQLAALEKPDAIDFDVFGSEGSKREISGSAVAFRADLNELAKKGSIADKYTIFDAQYR